MNWIGFLPVLDNSVKFKRGLGAIYCVDKSLHIRKDFAQTCKFLWKGDLSVN
jgi:hypothetical protein